MFLRCKQVSLHANVCGVVVYQFTPQPSDPLMIKSFPHTGKLQECINEVESCFERGELEELRLALTRYVIVSTNCDITLHIILYKLMRVAEIAARRLPCLLVNQ